MMAEAEEAMQMTEEAATIDEVEMAEGMEGVTTVEVEEGSNRPEIVDTDLARDRLLLPFAIDRGLRHHEEGREADGTDHLRGKEREASRRPDVQEVGEQERKHPLEVTGPYHPGLILRHG